jgi:hypothetical protein
MKSLRVPLLIALGLLVIYLGVRVGFAARDLTQAACSNPKPSVPGWSILLASVVFFVVGHYTAGQRDETHGLAPARHWWTGALAVHTALALFFFLGVCALIYETLGVWGQTPWNLQPITDYVRCARKADATTTLLVAVTVSFFAGHWLWFPARRSGR